MVQQWSFPPRCAADNANFCRRHYMSLLDIFDAYKFPELKSNSSVRDLNLQFTWRYMKFLQVICTCDAAFLFVLQAVNATGVVRTWDVHTVNENMSLQKMHQKYILLSENRANIPTSIPDFCYSCEQWQIKKKHDGRSLHHVKLDIGTCCKNVTTIKCHATETGRSSHAAFDCPQQVLIKKKSCVP